MGANALDYPVEGVCKHKAKLSRIAVYCINLRPPVQMRLKVDNNEQEITSPVKHEKKAVNNV